MKIDSRQVVQEYPALNPMKVSSWALPPIGDVREAPASIPIAIFCVPVTDEFPVPGPINMSMYVALYEIGMLESEGGCKLTVALADWVVSAWLVAVTVMA